MDIDSHKLLNHGEEVPGRTVVGILARRLVLANYEDWVGKGVGEGPLFAVEYLIQHDCRHLGFDSQPLRHFKRGADDVGDVGDDTSGQVALLP